MFRVLFYRSSLFSLSTSRCSWSIIFFDYVIRFAMDHATILVFYEHYRVCGSNNSMMIDCWIRGYSTAEVVVLETDIVYLVVTICVLSVLDISPRLLAESSEIVESDWSSREEMLTPTARVPIVYRALSATLSATPPSASIISLDTVINFKDGSPYSRCYRPEFRGRRELPSRSLHALDAIAESIERRSVHVKVLKTYTIERIDNIDNIDSLESFLSISKFNIPREAGYNTWFTCN